LSRFDLTKKAALSVVPKKKPEMSGAGAGSSAYSAGEKHGADVKFVSPELAAVPEGVVGMTR
jgi:hypothetical protein